MTKKLKLPLRISSSVANKYTLSKSDHGGMVDLTSDDGTVYVQHVTEAKALEFLETKTWTVVGASTSAMKATTARHNVELAQLAFASAKVTYDAAKDALVDAEAELEAATKSYLV
jgi:hypothetical protein